MPLTFGILIGVVAVFLGLAMYFGTPQKKAAVVIMCFGLGVTLLTLGVLALVINSGM
jgi:hypothetical protein